MVRARRADLADRGRALRRGEGNGLRAPIDLEHDAVGVCKESTAQRGKSLREDEQRLLLAALRDAPAAEPEAATGCLVDRPRGPGETNSIVAS
jgi:hypothetical protein